MKAVRQNSEFEPVLKYLAGRTGLSFPPNRLRDFDAGIRKVMARYAIADVGQFIQFLSTSRAAFDAVISAVTVGESYFFREPAQLSAIRQLVLPSLLKIRPPHLPLRLWSAGCSTGEEAYSVAILMEQEGLANVEVLGTDISAAALHKARKGEYSSWSLRSTQGNPDARYFHRNGRRFQVAERLRSRVRFAVLNLASPDYPSPANGTVGIDLILCRNVLIYFDQETVKRVAQRLFASLAEGGWLVTGPSDPPLWDHAAFTTVITPGGVFYRRPSSAAEPSRQQWPPSAEASPATAVRSQVIKRRRTARPAGRRRAGQTLKSPAGAGSPALPASEAALRIRELANAGSLDAAERTAAQAVIHHPLSPELHFLHGMVLLALDRRGEAEAALRRVIYLDRSLAAAHLTLGSLFQGRGELAAARRAFATAGALCAARPADELVPLTDGDTAGRLARSAEAQVRVLDDRIRTEI